MWIAVITCAAGIACGITSPVTKTGLQSFDHCMEVAKLAIDLAGYDRARFTITCAKVAPS